MTEPLDVQRFAVGDEVIKDVGDYIFCGWIVAAFRKRSQHWRYVVENADGVLMIMSQNQLRPFAPKPFLKKSPE
jgi:hypothetical protein